VTETEYEEIVNSSWAETFRFCRRRVSVFDDAEEIVLEVFFQLWKHKDRVDPGKVDRWIKRVAGNRITDYYRTMGSQKTIHADELFDELDKPSDMDLLKDICIREDMGAVLGIMENSMTEQQSTVIHMYYGCGKKGGQIAHEINLTPGAAQQCRMRALETLRKFFGNRSGLFSDEQCGSI
jgi:RNA polymerase sigma factor (sigma-70 family)